MFHLKSLVSTQESRASPKSRQRARSRQVGEVLLQEMEFAIPANLHPSADLYKAAIKEKDKNTTVGSIPKD